jgi:hypothetical protein
MELPAYFRKLRRKSKFETFFGIRARRSPGSFCGQDLLMHEKDLLIVVHPTLFSTKDFAIVLSAPIQ